MSDELKKLVGDRQTLLSADSMLNDQTKRIREVQSEKDPKKFR